MHPLGDVAGIGGMGLRRSGRRREPRGSFNQAPRPTQEEKSWFMAGAGADLQVTGLDGLVLGLLSFFGGRGGCVDGDTLVCLRDNVNCIVLLCVCVCGLVIAFDLPIDALEEKVAGFTTEIDCKGVDLV
ncbi:hypothetical protein GB937_006905 [Aspergillus fischeri]|nr:hypothetical protein GB937_006905 [Aspergillus fischeri]